jgi:acyl carrier protein
MNFIDLFNAVAQIAKPMHKHEVFAKSLDDKFADIGIDSLDTIMLIMYMSELYGIEEAVSKEWTPTTVGELHDLVMANKTQEPESIESAVEKIK